jgi:hypothetical protein
MVAFPEVRSGVEPMISATAATGSSAHTSNADKSRISSVAADGVDPASFGVSAPAVLLESGLPPPHPNNRIAASNGAGNVEAQRSTFIMISLSNGVFCPEAPGNAHRLPRRDGIHSRYTGPREREGMHGEPRLTQDFNATLADGPTACQDWLAVCATLELEPLPPDVEPFVRRTSVLPAFEHEIGVRIDFIF